ncbi:endothelin-converting enzyme 1 [Fomitiporia mediterranea MF3/22]|uniref:endothelin-converting enzyme 1 n=1 Tax=Fomitiporia mediterranea (strain MF3/22) TaxID=694068 RepID=UPI0004409094|nr:endothelin-converting enzyme 1 [Fomitiporia mediterranea MF3/22]EJD02334.1 endothelin-converting enzyme 1 [Fomitiporia mediterranea MF3/22]
MADPGYRDPRPSTDSEHAPLLRDPEREYSTSFDGSSSHPRSSQRKSFSSHVDDILREPLTTLTKILLVLALLLLLLTSVFIGLFAGAEHKLSRGRSERRPTPAPGVPITTTSTQYGTTTTTTTTTEKTTGTVTTLLPPSPTTIPAPLPTTEPGSTLCTSPDCVILAASILRNLDNSQDPCENFYEFANGGWLARTEIPPGKGIYGSFDVVSDENKRILRKILDPPNNASISSVTSDQYDEESLTKLRDLYTSCMNEDLVDERGDAPLRDVVQSVRDLYRSDNWKKLENSKEAEKQDNPQYGLTSAIAYLHSRGIGGLFNFDIDGDVGVDPDFMTLWFFQPDLGLPSKEYYKEKDIVKLYEDTLARMLLALDDTPDESASYSASGDDVLVLETDEKIKVWPPWPWPPWGGEDDDDDGRAKRPLNKTERAAKLAKSVVKFEKRVAKASLDLEIILQDPVATYNPVDFSELAEQLPQIDFPSYFSTFTPRNFPTRVILTSTTYAKSLSEILSSTDADTVEAYLVTRASLDLAPFLGYDTEVWKANRALREVLQGIKKGSLPDRSEWCVQRVEDALGFSAGRFFVEQAFGGDSKAKGTKVITDIISTFKESLKNLKWMDKESAKAASQKADAIDVKVGYPLSPNTESSRSIALYYRLVIVDKAEFFESMVSAQISETFKKWQLLGKQRDKQMWLMPPSMVNAYFNPPANEIVFPAGILQPPFFAYKWPAYIQYGAFGSIAAHELTHAFDSAGRLYNQKGKLEQWWTNATSEGFNKIQKCISEQYSNYTIDDGKGGKIHVNGNLTSGENIGDSGLIQSYRAWHGQFHTSLEEGREPLLPGLNYTQEQLFFIGFGQIWAQLIKPAAAVQRVRTDPHSPDKYRVEGTLANIPEFAAAFQCKEGTKLNPPKEQRCVFW